MSARRKLLIVAMLTLAAQPGAAQLGGLRLPALPLRAVTAPLTAPVEALPSRLATASALLRAHPRELERGPRGEVAVRRELLAVAPNADALARAQAAGFAVIADDLDDGIGLRLVVLRPPPGIGLSRALSQLRRLDPGGSYDINPLYTPSGRDTGVVLLPAAPQAAPGARIGLIDTGVASGHPAFAGSALESRGFAGTVAPAAHGTAVASLLVGPSGSARAARLLAADVFGSGPTGGNARSIIAACSWLARAGVGVVSISLVGPPNAALQAAVAALQARGTLVVAAVGNDGPASDPVYPAAYAGVVAVTAVDERGRLLPEAGRAAHTDFAAPGIVQAAALDGGYASVRGTSFAAPQVAGRLARLHPLSDPVTSAAALAALTRDGIASRYR